MFASLFALTLASAVQNAPAVTDKKTKPETEKKVCIFEQSSSSSRLGRKRVCRTEREMKAHQEQVERDSRL